MRVLFACLTGDCREDTSITGFGEGDYSPGIFHRLPAFQHLGFRSTTPTILGEVDAARQR